MLNALLEKLETIIQNKHRNSSFISPVTTKYKK